VQSSEAPSSGPDFSGPWTDGAKFSYDYPTVSPVRAQSEIWDYVKAELISRVARASEGRPSLAFDCGDTTVELGDWIRINSLPVRPPRWAVDRNGDQFEVTPDQPLYGWVRSRKLSPAGGARLEALIFFQSLVKRRSPSMYIDDDAGAGRLYTLDAPLFGTFDRFSGNAEPDSQSFEAGQEIKIYNRNMEIVSSNVYEIYSIGSDSTGPYIQLDGATSFDTSGEYVRLADYDDYDPINDPREYIYLADASATLGTDNDSADLYGR
jgi:hypothetical protein